MSVATKLTSILAAAFLRLMSYARKVETKLPFACIKDKDLLTLGRSVILTITIDAETRHLCPWFDRPDPSLMATGLVDDGIEVYGMVFHGWRVSVWRVGYWVSTGKRVTVAPFP